MGTRVPRRQGVEGSGDASVMAVAPTSAGVDRARIERIVSEVLAGSGRAQAAGVGAPLVVNISARHMHITQEQLEILYGAGTQLTPMKWLYQDGQFASEQTVDLIGPRRRML